MGVKRTLRHTGPAVPKPNSTSNAVTCRARPKLLTPISMRLRVAGASSLADSDQVNLLPTRQTYTGGPLIGSRRHTGTRARILSSSRQSLLVAIEYRVSDVI